MNQEGYVVLVYTTPVNSAFRAIWLVPQSRDIKCYSPPGGSRRKKMAREPHFIGKEKKCLGIAIKLVLYIYSPQCRWIAVDIYLVVEVAR